MLIQKKREGTDLENVAHENWAFDCILKTLLDDSSKSLDWNWAQRKTGRNAVHTDKEWLEAGVRKKVAIPLNFSIIDFCSKKGIFIKNSWVAVKTEKSASTHKFLKDPVIYTLIMYQVNISFGFLSWSWMLHIYYQILKTQWLY